MSKKRPIKNRDANSNRHAAGIAARDAFRIFKFNGEGRPYRPAYVSLETLAYLLDMETRTIRAYVKGGLLPAPETIGREKRWDIEEVFAFIRAERADGNGSGRVGINGASPAADAFSMGIRHHGTAA